MAVAGLQVGSDCVPTTIQDSRRRLAPIVVQEEAKLGHCTTASPCAMVALVNNDSPVCSVPLLLKHRGLGKHARCGAGENASRDRTSERPASDTGGRVPRHK